MEVMEDFKVKVYWLFRYYLKLRAENIGIKIDAENNFNPKKLIKDDASLQLNDLIEKHTNLGDEYSYRFVINKLTKNFWHAEIRVKGNFSTSSINFNLVYKLGKRSNKVLLFKF